MLDLMDQIKSEMKKVYLEQRQLIVLTYSGGKDSSLVLKLFWEMLMSLPVSKRTKTVHLLTSDTGVEAPIMEDYLYRTLAKIKKAAAEQQLPIQIHVAKPKKSFWFKILGRGTLIPTPKTRTRWCTHLLKIQNTTDVIKDLIASAPVLLGEKHQLILTLGVRNEESARRAASIEHFEIEPNSLWSNHTDNKEVLCFNPIRFVTADELWFNLLEDFTLPWGTTIDELSAQYGEGIMECGMKTSSDEGMSCGGSAGRLGCWTCGMVNGDDPMLKRYISEGKKEYQYLLDWKNLMLAMRNDIRYREIIPRQQFKRKMKELQEKQTAPLDLFSVMDEGNAENHFLSFKRVEYQDYAPGGMTVEGRKILLEYLLYIQETTGLSLISEQETQEVLNEWVDTDQIVISGEELIPRPFDYDGELVFLPNKTVNRSLTKTNNKIYYITIDVNKEEQEFYAYLKERQRITQKSYYFFPISQEFQKEKLVWNKAKFIVCGKGITEKIQAAEEIYKWLGWQYDSFTEESKQTAIQHLILSALDEGITARNKNKRMNAITDLPNLIDQDNGQLSFAL